MLPNVYQKMFQFSMAVDSLSFIDGKIVWESLISQNYADFHG